jgi:hypothetical protein
MLDVRQPDWPRPPARRLGCRLRGQPAAHLALGLHRGADARRRPALRPGGRLIVYGPFIVEGEPTSPSNQAFDIDLRSRDAAWGLRHLSDVQDEARAAGLGSRPCTTCRRTTGCWCSPGPSRRPPGAAVPMW